MERTYFDKKLTASSEPRAADFNSSRDGDCAGGGVADGSTISPGSISAMGESSGIGAEKLAGAL